ncbi:MAG: hydrolase [Candidatus Nitrosocaldaceae archaeon]|nr:MAG: hydrolase [Candidatus Nitrosocaldaceae archaeon]
MNVKIATTEFRLKPYNDFKGFEEDVISMLDKATDADIILFGEWFTLGLLYSLTDKPDHKDVIKIAEYTDDLIGLLNREARDRRITIIAGSTVEEENNRYYDTCFVFHKDKVFKHRKTHLFPLERELWKLDEYDKINAIQLDDLKIGICICYESQIPECSRALVLQGCNILFCPSFTITNAGYNRIRYSCHARCIENQVIMVLSSSIGNLGFVKGIGKSAILSPCDKPWPDNGIIVECEDDIAIADINIDDINITREKGAARTHKDRIRKNELYKRWLYGV